MNSSIRLVLAIFTAYRLASLISSDEGPYLPFLYKDQRETGVFEWLRMKAGAYDYGLDGKPETNFARGLACPLCTGVYLSGLVAALYYGPARITDFFLLWLGISGAQVFLENLTSDEAIEGAIEEVAESMEG